MSKLTDLFNKKEGLKGGDFHNKDIDENKDVFGKQVQISVDRFSNVMIKGYRIEYLNKDGDVVIHFYSKRWPDNFIDIVQSNIKNMGDQCECEYYPEVNSWFVLIKNFSVRRFGGDADASYISSLLEKL